MQLALSKSLFVHFQLLRAPTGCCSKCSESWNELLHDVEYIKTEERRFAWCLTSSDNSATSRNYLQSVLQRVVFHTYRATWYVWNTVQRRTSKSSTSKSSTCTRRKEIAVCSSGGSRKLVRLERALFFFPPRPWTAPMVSIKLQSAVGVQGTK